MSEPLPSNQHSLPYSHAWITLAACFLVVAIINGAGLSFGVFLNPLKESFSASSASVAAAYSVTLWVFALFGLVSGWAVDSYGPRITIMVGALLLGSGYLLSSLIGALWQLYAA